MLFFKYSYYFIPMCFVLLWVAAQLGVLIRQRHPLVNEHEDKDLGLIQTATLTLLALIIGFSFSMAINRYDLRKMDEAVEANAISTEYLSVSVLPTATCQEVRALLKKYLAMRIRFYQLRDSAALHQLKPETQLLQRQLWAAVSESAKRSPSAITALPVAGMNEVINAEGYAQAISWNRIPLEAWLLLFLIAIAANILVGYAAHDAKPRSVLLCVLPIVLSIALSLIADIDSPRGGLIRIQPQNLEKLGATFQLNESSAPNLG